MSITVAITGASGAMGGEVLKSILESPLNLSVRCVLFEAEKRLPAFVKKTLKKYSERV